MLNNDTILRIYVDQNRNKRKGTYNSFSLSALFNF